MANSNDENNIRANRQYPTTVATNHHHCPPNRIDAFHHSYYDDDISNAPRSFMNHGFHGDLDKKENQDYQYFRPRSTNPSNEHPFLLETITRHSGVPRYTKGFQFPYQSRQMNQPTPDTCYHAPFQVDANIDNSEPCHYPHHRPPPTDQLPYMVPPCLDHASNHHPRPMIMPNRASCSGRFKKITTEDSSSLPSSSIPSLAPSPSSSPS